MDRNTIIGFVLMGAVLVLFTWLGRPSEEQLAEQQRYNDSIAAVQQKKEAEATLIAETAPTTLPLTEMSDSALIAERMRVFGDLAQATSGTEETLTLENDSISISLSTKGGMIVSSELKKYKDYRGENVRLIREGEAEFNYTFITNTNRIINTKDLFFSLGGSMIRPYA